MATRCGDAWRWSRGFVVFSDDRGCQLYGYRKITYLMMKKSNEEDDLDHHLVRHLQDKAPPAVEWSGVLQCLRMDAHVMLVCCYRDMNAAIKLQFPFQFDDLVNSVCQNFDGLTHADVCFFFKIPGYNSFKLQNDIDMENMIDCCLWFVVRLSVKKRGAEKPAKQPAKKGKAAAKDPSKPKRPASAFFIFMEEFRKTYKEKHPNNKSVAAVGKAGGDKWKSMSEAEKAPFVSRAEKRKTEYNKNIEAYNKRITMDNIMVSTPGYLRVDSLLGAIFNRLEGVVEGLNDANIVYSICSLQPLHYN
ncbi:hypothetical protein TEA_017812 [Camellia sinensis var. sinensis]|uniref:HMG box domain-containing protein n=1 Tax=Camellia sinensis var. sinensis TaxID=542762 RepID=A0A4S4D8G5_CAMSN|nr:hypothetical protein TEA_017812 [Camellia sinensis var. sinensis]